jgi:hypothetical protein
VGQEEQRAGLQRLEAVALETGMERRDTRVEKERERL